MEKVLADFQAFASEVLAIKPTLEKIVRKTNTGFYNDKLRTQLNDLNRKYQFLKVELRAVNQATIQEKISRFQTDIDNLLKESKPSERLKLLLKLERLIPEIEAEIQYADIKPRLFDIPQEIPLTDSRVDVEEAIRDYEHGCYVSALVLCRRAYEGVLVEAYKEAEKREPVSDHICQKCKATTRPNAYLGIAKLHSWAIGKRLISDKLTNIGYLVSDLGAGGAHPLKEFPRDKEVAKLSIVSTITLLKEVYSGIEKLEVSETEKETSTPISH